MQLDKILLTPNLATELDEQTLIKVGDTVCEHFMTDLESRSEWESKYTKWLDMACQKIDHKTKPWVGAANVKYPLMTNAALQFNARVVPALMPNAEPVGAKPVGPDSDGQKAEVAKALASHMNYQLTSEMDEWEEEFDKLLMSLSISGLEYKKTYYDPHLRRIVSRHITPLRLVVNYYATDLESTRKTEIFRWTRNRIEEKIRAGIFVSVDWEKTGEPNIGEQGETEEDNHFRRGLEEPSTQDNATPYTVLEYHGWWDMDDDGYEEPYIITVLEHTKQVLQITPRFVDEAIEYNEQGEVVRITPQESYTKYGFVPNPDGSFYDIGFGHLLYPLNAVVNTATNQLLDAGTQQTMSSGFIGRGAKLRQGMFQMRAGKWLSVNAMGDDLRKSIVPMPVPDPSNVLLALVQYMVEAGEKMSATTDIFTGQNPGQNQKATTTQAVREEGQKVFTAIYKRIRRSLKGELDKHYDLNNLILTSGEDTLVHESAQMFQVEGKLYDKKLYNIQPSADPNIAIKEQKMQKDITVIDAMQSNGIGNITEATRRLFNTMEVEDIDKLIPPDAKPAPDPKAQESQMKAQIESAKLELERERIALERAKAQFDAEVEKEKLKLEALKVGQAADHKGLDVGIKMAEIDSKLQLEKEKAKHANTGDNNSE